MNDLSKYTDDELLNELQQRAERRNEETPIKCCDECKHFKPYKGIGLNVPDTYNACSKGHKMSFRQPANPVDDNWGYYKRSCKDREEPSDDRENEIPKTYSIRLHNTE
jgi:hypothetical protein